MEVKKKIINNNIYTIKCDDAERRMLLDGLENGLYLNSPCKNRKLNELRHALLDPNIPEH